MINENVAFAKSILSKSGITRESPEWKNYDKIREICGTDYGYVGILTRLWFVDGIDDIDEIKSIYDILKTSKIDIPKLNKMSYSDILNLFHDEITGKNDKKDYELIHKDSVYSYYEVYTYEGNLKLGSPAWCLKTKKHWDSYKSVYDRFFIVIDNKYKRLLLSPDNNYLSEYKNSKKQYIRYGISLKEEGDYINFMAFNDNNIRSNYMPENWTYFGVMSTIINLVNGVKKSYYESFRSCKYIGNGYHKIVDIGDLQKRFNFSDGTIKYLKTNDLYLKFSEEYSYPVAILVFGENYPCVYLLTDDKNNKYDTSILSGVNSKKILEDYARNSKYYFYEGIRYKLGLVTKDQILSDKNLVSIVNDKWAIFDESEKYYLVVNLKLEKYELPTITNKTRYQELNRDKLIGFWIDKMDHTFSICCPYSNLHGHSDELEIIKAIDEFERLNKDDENIDNKIQSPKENKLIESPKEDTKKIGSDSKVKKFLNFFKKNENVFFIKNFNNY